MNAATKNIVVVLGIASVVFALYYFLTQGSAATLESATAEQQRTELIAAAQTFSERQRALNEIRLDIDIFSDDSFRSLRSFSTTPAVFTEGRDNPFLPADGTSSVSSAPASSEDVSE